MIVTTSQFTSTTSYQEGCSGSQQPPVDNGTVVDLTDGVLTVRVRSGAQGPQGFGLQSLDGVQGLQGMQGNEGAQGDHGLDGVQGPLGFQGVTGSQGGQGYQGDYGTQGIQGGDGFQGLQGDKGGIGAQGDVGQQGCQGNDGIQGVEGNGLQGPQGFQGDSGELGYQGFQGNDGVSGEDGLQGKTGCQGEAGEKGDVGETGIDGAQGYQGSVGGQGDAGNQGLAGEIGSQGSQGLQGTIGEGVQGNRGDDGEQGPQGLVGEPGFQGDIGEKGLQGEIGNQGDTGNQGFQGLAGMLGFQGDTGGQGLQGPVSDETTAINSRTDTAYTFSLGDSNNIVSSSSSSPVTWTIPSNANVAFPVNTVIALVQLGTGTVTIVPESGVTVNGLSMTLPGQKGTASLMKTFPDVWELARINLKTVGGSSLFGTGDIPVGGGTTPTIQNIIGADNILASRGVVTLSAGTYSVTVPVATGSGNSICVYMNGDGIVTLVRSAADTIDDQSTAYMIGKGDWAVLTDQSLGKWSLQRNLLLDDLQLFANSTKRMALANMPTVSGFRARDIGGTGFNPANSSDGAIVPGGSTRLTNGAWADLTGVIIPQALNTVSWAIFIKGILPVPVSNGNVQIGLGINNNVSMIDQLTADATKLCLRAGSNPVIPSSWVIDGAEHIFGLVFDATTVKLLVDGNIVATTTVVTGMTNTANRMEWFANNTFVYVRYIAWAW